jgi:hypothetical protein
VTFAAHLDPRQVQALLVNRQVDLLNPASPEHDLYSQTVTGVATEIVPIVGADPAPGPVRDLAVWCLALGVAASLETALFPEQQLGEDARARELRVRYLAVRAELRGRAGSGSGPTGSFPPALPWPDPVEQPVRTIW